MSETTPIDGTHCMACGHHWRYHAKHGPCCHKPTAGDDGPCKCKRIGVAWEVHNREDWIARITALESDLATAIKERDAAVAAGKVLAARIATATRTDGYEDLVYRADEMDSLLRLGIGGGTVVDDNANPLALAWVKAAQEASNGN